MSYTLCIPISFTNVHNNVSVLTLEDHAYINSLFPASVFVHWSRVEIDMAATGNSGLAIISSLSRAVDGLNWANLSRTHHLAFARLGGDHPSALRLTITPAAGFGTEINNNANQAPLPILYFGILGGEAAAYNVHVRVTATGSGIAAAFLPPAPEEIADAPAAAADGAA